MATCPLTSSYNYADNCEAYAGGVRALYPIESYNLDKTTFAATAGVITALAPVATKAFRRYVPKKNTASWTDSPTKNESGALTYAPTIILPIPSLITTLRQEVQLLGRNYLVWVILDNNGIYRMFGYDNYMEMTTGDVQGGTLQADGQKQTLTFVGEETIPAYQITSPSVLSGLGIVAP